MLIEDEVLLVLIFVPRFAIIHVVNRTANDFNLVVVGISNHDENFIRLHFSICSSVCLV